MLTHFKYFKSDTVIYVVLENRNGCTGFEKVDYDAFVTIIRVYHTLLCLNLSVSVSFFFLHVFQNFYFITLVFPRFLIQKSPLHFTMNSVRGTFSTNNLVIF